jgi:hypothetical protein
MADDCFKKCPLCGREWKDVDDLLNDPELTLNGYQGDLRRLLGGEEKCGLLLFTHHKEECGTTLAFAPSSFKYRAHQDK